MGKLNLPEDADKDEIIQAYVAAMTLLDDAIAQWPTLTGTQKNTWIAANFDAVLRIQRGMLRLLGKIVG